tara:strand:+ start:471 stop:827 length:357 start_codon:yes stop_codon:yes gene_type:complete
MADTISVVKGDSVSNLLVSLVREDTGVAFGVGSGGSITLRIRKTGTTAVPTHGIVLNDSTLTSTAGDFVFPLGTWLTNAATVDGYYEGELEATVQVDGVDKKQTVFEPLTIRVRDDFD